MKYHPLLGPAPTVGCEIEVADWQNSNGYQSVIEDLIEAGLMQNDVYDSVHQYHCDCSHCGKFGALVNHFPVMFKAQRDGSLPDGGAEFISTPFSTVQVFIEEYAKGLEILGNHYEWDAPAGHHIHTHALGVDGRGLETVIAGHKAIQTLYGFLPELFTLASQTGMQRPLEYRLPTPDGESHGAISIEREGGPYRLEWRLWEAVPDNINYMLGAAYVSSALTQLMFRKDVYRFLSGVGDLMHWDDRNRNLHTMLGEVNPERMTILFDLITKLTPISEDDFAKNIVEGFFANA